MSEKDYKFIASALLALKPEDSGDSSYAEGRLHQWETTVTIVADRLAVQPRFDRDRFVAACGM